MKLPARNFDFSLRCHLRAHYAELNAHNADLATPFLEQDRTLPATPKSRTFIGELTSLGVVGALPRPE